MSRLLGSGNKQKRQLSDGSVWPVNEQDELDSVQWRLRYATPTPEDALYAASVIEAYEYLVYEATREKVALVRRELRAGFRDRVSNPSSPRADFAPRGEATPSALSRDTATAEGVSKLPAPDAGGSS
ncbi:hypothetical protein [Nocardia africana]